MLTSGRDQEEGENRFLVLLLEPLMISMEIHESSKESKGHHQLKAETSIAAAVAAATASGTKPAAVASGAAAGSGLGWRGRWIRPTEICTATVQQDVGMTGHSFFRCLCISISGSVRPSVGRWIRHPSVHQSVHSSCLNAELRI